MAAQIKANQILNGTFGKVWIDNVIFANVKSFEAKITPSYEEVNLSGKLGTSQKYMGYAIEGTVKMDKVDFELAKKISQGFITGNIPEFKINAELDDTSGQGSGRIALSGVTFDEVMLLAYENKTMAEEEFSFKAEAVMWL